MIPVWTGILLGKMHNAEVSQRELAKEMDVTHEYLCNLLAGKKKVKNAKQRCNEAFEQILRRRREDENI